MKKFCLVIMLLLLPLSLMGCQEKVSSIKENLSEVTEIYFFGTNVNDRASISVGERENPYILDGIHGKTCGFSLIDLHLLTPREENIISVTLTINGKDSQISLEINPISQSYMFDLGYKLNEQDEIKLSYGNKTIEFENKSNKFGIKKEEATSIGCKKLIDEISHMTKKGRFEGECYLKILGESGSDYKELFWCFSIIGRHGESYNVIISVKDGSVLAGN